MEGPRQLLSGAIGKISRGGAKFSGGPLKFLPELPITGKRTFSEAASIVLRRAIRKRRTRLKIVYFVARAVWVLLYGSVLVAHAALALLERVVPVPPIVEALSFVFTIVLFIPDLGEGWHRIRRAVKMLKSLKPPAPKVPDLRTL